MVIVSKICIFEFIIFQKIVIWTYLNSTLLHITNDNQLFYFFLGFDTILNNSSLFYVNVLI
jgi:hypothetical protein